MLVTSALGKWRSENPEFKVILKDTGCSRLVWAKKKLCFKTKQTNPQKSKQGACEPAAGIEETLVESPDPVLPHHGMQ